MLRKLGVITYLDDLNVYEVEAFNVISNTISTLEDEELKRNK